MNSNTNNKKKKKGREVSKMAVVAKEMEKKLKSPNMNDGWKTIADNDEFEDNRVSPIFIESIIDNVKNLKTIDDFDKYLDNINKNNLSDYSKLIIEDIRRLYQIIDNNDPIEITNEKENIIQFYKRADVIEDE